MRRFIVATLMKSDMTLVDENIEDLAADSQEGFSRKRSTHVVDITTHPVFASSVLATPLPVASASKPPNKMLNQLLDELLDLPPSDLFDYKKLSRDLENSLAPPICNPPEPVPERESSHIQVHAHQAYADFMMRDTPKIDRDYYQPIDESSTSWNAQWNASEDYSPIESGGSSLEVLKYTESSFDSSSGVDLDGEDDDDDVDMEMELDADDSDSGIREIRENMDAADARGTHYIASPPDIIEIPVIQTDSVTVKNSVRLEDHQQNFSLPEPSSPDIETIEMETYADHSVSTVSMFPSQSSLKQRSFPPTRPYTAWRASEEKVVPRMQKPDYLQLAPQYKRRTEEGDTTHVAMDNLYNVSLSWKPHGRSSYYWPVESDDNLPLVKVQPLSLPLIQVSSSSTDLGFISDLVSTTKELKKKKKKKRGGAAKKKAKIKTGETGDTLGDLESDPDEQVVLDEAVQLESKEELVTVSEDVITHLPAESHNGTSTPPIKDLELAKSVRPSDSGIDLRQEMHDQESVLEIDHVEIAEIKAREPEVVQEVIPEETPTLSKSTVDDVPMASRQPHPLEVDILSKPLEHNPSLSPDSIQVDSKPQSEMSQKSLKKKERRKKAREAAEAHQQAREADVAQQQEALILEEPFVPRKDETVNMSAVDTSEQVFKKSIPTKSGKSSFNVVITRKKASGKPTKESESDVPPTQPEENGFGLGIALLKEVEVPPPVVIHQQSTPITHIPMLPEDHTEWPQLGLLQKVDFKPSLFISPDSPVKDLSITLNHPMEEFNHELRHVGTSPPPEEFLDGIPTGVPIVADDINLFSSEPQVFDQVRTVEEEVPLEDLPDHDAKLQENFVAPQAGHHPAPPPLQHVNLSGFPFSADPNSSLAPPPDIGHHFLGYAFVPAGYIPVVPMPVPVMMMAHLPGMGGFPFHSGDTHSEEEEECDDIASIDLPRFNFEECSEWLQSRMHSVLSLDNGFKLTTMSK